MAAEERADSFGPQVGDSIVTASRQDDRIGKDNFTLVDAALEVTQHIHAPRYVIAEVADSLHHFAPGRGLVIPAGITVEFLIVLDKGAQLKSFGLPIQRRN